MEHHQLVVWKRGVRMNRRSARLLARLGGSIATNADNEGPCSERRRSRPHPKLGVEGQQSSKALLIVSPERRGRRPTTSPTSPQRLLPTQR